MLFDENLIDVDANEINLSDEQKWKIVFVRALYSRASIFIFDDIFSAINAYVNRHFFEKTLTEKLDQSWTRIFVIHYVILYISKIKYLVLFKNNQALYVDVDKELHADDDFKVIFAHDVKKHQQTKKKNLTFDVDDISQKIMFDQTRRNSSFANQEM